LGVDVMGVMGVMGVMNEVQWKQRTMGRRMQVFVCSCVCKELRQAGRRDLKKGKLRAENNTLASRAALNHHSDPETICFQARAMPFVTPAAYPDNLLSEDQVRLVKFFGV
jgi:hypothetical protein